MININSIYKFEKILEIRFKITEKFGNGNLIEFILFVHKSASPQKHTNNWEKLHWKPFPVI